MDKKEQTKVKNDIKLITKIFDNVCKAQSKIDDMVIEIGLVASSFEESDRRYIVDGLDAAEDTIELAKEMMFVFADQMSPLGYIKKSMYDLDFKTFKDKYGKYVKYYDAFRGAYDYFFDMYDSLARHHYVPKITYIREI